MKCKPLLFHISNMHLKIKNKKCNHHLFVFRQGCFCNETMLPEKEQQGFYIN